MLNVLSAYTMDCPCISSDIDCIGSCISFVVCDICYICGPATLDLCKTVMHNVIDFCIANEWKCNEFWLWDNQQLTPFEFVYFICWRKLIINRSVLDGSKYVYVCKTGYGQRVYGRHICWDDTFTYGFTCWHALF